MIDLVESLNKHFYAITHIHSEPYQRKNEQTKALLREELKSRAQLKSAHFIDSEDEFPCF